MTSRKILIVEDEFITAHVMKKSLENAGYKVSGIAVEGCEAVDLARSHHPELILMDINLMGDMNGIEAARIIGGFSSAVIVFITGYQEPELKKKAMELKPAAYLIKPLHMKQLRQLIEGLPKKSSPEKKNSITTEQA